MKNFSIVRCIFSALLVFLSAAANLNAAPDAAAGERKAATCSACHGIGGNSTNAVYPSLAAQTPLYTYYQLLQFREGRRVNDQMSPMAANLTDADMKDIAAYYSSQKLLPNVTAIDTARIEAGKLVAARNHCGSCHLPSYAGQNHIPRLAGLQFDYLLTQLSGFKTGERQDIDGSMASAAQPLSNSDMTNIAGYLASLK